MVTSKAVDQARHLQPIALTVKLQDACPKQFCAKDQCVECGDLAEAFPRHVWGQLCSMVHGKVERMNEKWDCAKRAFDLPPRERGFKARLDRGAIAGVKLFMTFFFLTVDQFQELFNNIEPAALGMKIYSLLDYDMRNLVKGVILHAFECPNPFKFRHLQFYNNTFLHEGERLLEAEETIRPEHCAGRSASAWP